MVGVNLCDNLGDNLVLTEMLLTITCDEMSQVNDKIYKRGNSKEIIATSEKDSFKRKSMRQLQSGT